MNHQLNEVYHNNWKTELENYIFSNIKLCKLKKNVKHDHKDFKKDELLNKVMAQKEYWISRKKESKMYVYMYL